MKFVRPFLLSHGMSINCMNDVVGRNPDALPPTTVFGRFFVRLGGFVRFFGSAEGIFALRLAIVSVALWIPSVCHTSAWFYYENRGIWALIMAQVCSDNLAPCLSKNDVDWPGGVRW